MKQPNLQKIYAETTEKNPNETIVIDDKPIKEYFENTSPHDFAEDIFQLFHYGFYMGLKTKQSQEIESLINDLNSLLDEIDNSKEFNPENN